MTVFNGTIGNDILPPADSSNAGNDQFFPLLGNDVVDGGAGKDTLTIDYSSLSGDIYSNIDSSNSLTGQLFSNDTYNYIHFTNIEQLKIKTGTGNDNLNFSGNSLAGNATLAVDAGAGFDHLGLFVEGLSGNTYFVVSGANVSTNRGSFKNFEAYSISVGDGNDIITTGSGDDMIYGGNGNNVLKGGLGNDVIVAGTGNDQVNGGGGNDTIIAGMGRNIISAGDGDDTIGAFGEASGIDRVNGGEGYDSWVGDYSSETRGLRVNVLSNGTANISNGTSVNNIESFGIAVGSGDDKIFTSGGWLDIYDNSLADLDTITIDYSASSNNISGSVEGGAAVALSGAIISDFQTQSALFSGMEKVSVITGVGDDELYVSGDVSYLKNLTHNAGIGSDILNIFLANAVDDLQFSVVGNSTQTNFGIYKNFETFNIRTGSGNDTVVTAAGNDSIEVGSGHNTVNSGSGSDQIRTSGSGLFDGGDGTDYWYGDYYENYDNLAFVWNNDGSGSVSNGTLLNNIENVNFTSGIGTSTAHLLGFGATSDGGGYGDADSVTADSSFSTANMIVETVLSVNYLGGVIKTEDGTQSMAWSNYEEESIVTGSGDDYFTLFAGETSNLSPVVLDAGAGVDILALHAPGRNSAISFEVTGSVANSNIGQFLNFETFSIIGSIGNDVINTGSGDDAVSGAAGDDLLNGGTGADILYGGIGLDTFRFTDLNFGADQIVEFESGQDLLSFSLNVAQTFADFIITGNGTNEVVVSHGIDTITVTAVAPLTLTETDFIFA